MQTDTVNRPPDMRSAESKNVGWFILPRRQSSDGNMTIVVQRFDKDGDFEEHAHDLEQFFYVTAGALEMTIGDDTRTYVEGDFVSVGRKVVHAGRNVHVGESEWVVIDYWPADSADRIGLD